MKEKRWMIDTVFIFLIIIGMFILYESNLKDYILILIPILLFFIVKICYDIKYLFLTEKEKYQLEVKKIIRIYKTVLVETDEFPTLDHKYFIDVKSMDDMITAQMEVRNPIFYIRKDMVTIFYLFNNDVVLTYMIRPKEDENPSLEETIRMEKIELKDIEIL